MSPEMLRVLGALVLAVILGLFAAFTRGQPYRQSSLGLSALALVLLAGYNAGPLYGFDGIVLAGFALALLVAAMVCYVMSWVKGEVLKRHELLRTRMKEQIQRRREATSKQPPAKS